MDSKQQDAEDKARLVEIQREASARDHEKFLREVEVYRVKRKAFLLETHTTLGLVDYVIELEDRMAYSRPDLPMRSVEGIK